VRGLTKCPANNSSSDIMFVPNGSVDYAEYMERNNNFVDEVIESVIYYKQQPGNLEQ